MSGSGLPRDGITYIAKDVHLIPALRRQMHRDLCVCKGVMSYHSESPTAELEKHYENVNDAATITRRYPNSKVGESPNSEPKSVGGRVRHVTKAAWR